MAAARRLCQVNSHSTELTSVRAEQDELRTKSLGLEEEKCKLKEHYNLLDGAKASLDDQVANLDGLVEHFFHRIDALVEKNKVLEIRVGEQCR